MQTAQKNCAGCGRTFGCGVDSKEGCWCASLPQAVASPDPAADCYCPECLATQLSQSQSLEQRPLVEGEDYYFEDGLLVMTAAYHIKRGSCCGNRCVWCPFDPRHEAGVTQLASNAVSK